MTPEALLSLIGQGENSGIEFKRDDLRPEQLAREVVAFANFQGGRVLIGVEDDGTLSGIQRPDLERWVMDTVFGRTVHPQLLPYYEVVSLDGGMQVAVVTVLPGTAKPYVVRHHCRPGPVCASPAPSIAAGRTALDGLPRGRHGLPVAR